MQGCGGVGHAGCGGVGHVVVRWGGSCRGGVGCVMQGCGGVGHVGGGWMGYSCRGIYIQLFMSDSNSKNNNS